MSQRTVSTSTVSDTDKKKYINNVNKLIKLDLSDYMLDSHVNHNIINPTNATCMYYSTNNDVLLYTEPPKKPKLLDNVIDDEKELIDWLKDDNNLILYYGYLLNNDATANIDVIKTVEHRSDKLVELIKLRSRST